MSWKRETDSETLAARLRAVLPEYKPVSERQGDALGTYKSIDREGNVWLIRWLEPYTDERGHHVVRRQKKLEIKAGDVATAGIPVIQGRRRRDIEGTLDD